MKSTPVTTVEDYIAAQPAAMQRILKRVRATIQKAVPDAVEAISYSMPAYKLHGRVLLYFAGWKDHYAIYPGSAATLVTLKSDLADYQVSKGTIRFAKTDPVPVALIKRIAIVRASELADRLPVKAARAARR